MPEHRLQQLLHLLAESPDDGFLLFALAKEHEKLGEPEKALDRFLELRQKQPTYVGLYYHLGKLYEKRQEPQSAWEVYSAGMDIARRVGDQHAFSELAGARLALGDEEDFV